MSQALGPGDAKSKSITPLRRPRSNNRFARPPTPCLRACLHSRLEKSNQMTPGPLGRLSSLALARGATSGRPGMSPVTGTVRATALASRRVSALTVRRAVAMTPAYLRMAPSAVAGPVAPGARDNALAPAATPMVGTRVGTRREQIASSRGRSRRSKKALLRAIPGRNRASRAGRATSYRTEGPGSAPGAVSGQAPVEYQRNTGALKVRNLRSTAAVGALWNTYNQRVSAIEQLPW
jgi:hypothetical protein